MSASPIDTAELAGRLTCCAQDVSERDRRVQLALFRLLAGGEPVEPTRLAAETGVPAAEVVELLGRWWGVRTDDGRVVAFQGLSVVQAPHRLKVDGQALYTWCAWDTLFLPQLLGTPAAVESTCPTTGATVSLDVGPDGPAELSPAEAVMSFIDPGESFGDNVIQSFCRFVHFFASPEAAEHWTESHAGTYVMPIEDGYEIGRRTNAAQWGELL
jgi:alkylmercury lyase